MAADISRAIAEAYRWQRRLANASIVTPYCHIVANPACPDVWDSNHADAVTAETEAEIEAVLGAMDAHLGHTSWRVFHTDAFTPDAFLARLACDGFEERPVTIQMALPGDLEVVGGEIELREVVRDADWDALLRLVLVDHAEGKRTGHLEIGPEISAGIVAGYRAKSGGYKFHLTVRSGAPVAYGAYAVAPNGLGMIEDLYTLPAARRQGIATAMIAAFVRCLRAARCQTIFIGALAAEPAKHLYARLGFRPVGLARAWVRNTNCAA